MEHSKFIVSSKQIEAVINRLLLEWDGMTDDGKDVDVEGGGERRRQEVLDNVGTALDECHGTRENVRDVIRFLKEMEDSVWTAPICNGIAQIIFSNPEWTTKQIGEIARALESKESQCAPSATAATATATAAATAASTGEQREQRLETRTPLLPPPTIAVMDLFHGKSYPVGEIMQHPGEANTDWSAALVSTRAVP